MGRCGLWQMDVSVVAVIEVDAKKQEAEQARKEGVQ